MNFQYTVLMISGIILLLALSFIAYSLYHLHSNRKYPPVVGDCPDYWESVEEGGKAICKNSKKLGTCGDKMDFSGPQFVGDDGICNKSKWAKSCKLSWDGITNVSDVCTKHL